MAQIVQLHPRPALAGFLRVGHTSHRKLEALHAAGRLPYRRVVFDAAHLSNQIDLLNALRSDGREIVLDTNFAEAAADGCWHGAIRRLPWANPDRPWRSTDFVPRRNANLAKLIAEFCVRHDVTAVLAPTHLVGSSEDAWCALDQQFCETLRQELDQQGGGSIAIDYQFLIASHLLRDEGQLENLLQGVPDLPIQNVWLRIAGFGATATGAATCHVINSARRIHAIERPLIIDNAGGFAALACLAFGAVGGVCHGVGQKETFNAYSWNHPPTRGGGNRRRILIPELDRYFLEDQLRSIFATKFGRSRFACNNTNCCRDGIDDMIDNHHSHFLFQRSSQLESLSVVAESQRAGHFLIRQLDPAVRSARRATRLRISDENVRTAIDQVRRRLVRMYDALSELDARGDPTTRCRPVQFRGGGGLVSAVLGR
jgi:hypothetical protein